MALEPKYCGFFFSFFPDYFLPFRIQAWWTADHWVDSIARNTRIIYAQLSELCNGGVMPHASPGGGWWRGETRDSRRETGDSRQVTVDRRQKTGDGRRESGDRGCKMGDGRQATGDRRRKISHQENFALLILWVNLQFLKNAFNKVGSSRRCETKIN